MTYNTVSVTGTNIFGNALGEVVNVAFAPMSFYFDTPNNTQINAPVATGTSNSSGVWTVSGIIDPTPDSSGMAWRLTVSDKSSGQQLYSAVVQIAYSNGASQHWLSLTPPPAPADTSVFLTASGAATGAGQFLESTGSGSNVLNFKYGMAPINVLNFGADPTGVADSTTAIQNAINAATGALAPSSHSRVPTNPVYAPTGSYKVSADLLIQSTQGFNFFGDGVELTILVASGTGFTTAVLNVDGSYGGRYHGFTLKGDATEQVTNGINLTWTTGASRSTTGNNFHDIRIRNLNFVTGFSMAGITNRQVDSTRLDCIVIGGGQTTGSWSNSGNWQKGFEFGNGTFANIYDQVLTRCEASNVYYGFYNNVSSFSLNGAQPANNYCDFYMNPGAQTTVTNVQSQNSGQLVISPSNFSPQPVSFNDVQMKTSFLGGASNAFITLAGGYWNFNNVNATNLQISSAYVNGLISITGSGVNRPCVALFNNLSMRGPRSGAFALTNAIVSATGYTNYEPTTGNSTYATGDIASLNVGGIWTTVGGPGALPVITYITATGTTSYTIPASSQTLDVLIEGGGAGGSSGAFSASTNAGGGAGGAGGGVSRQQFATAALTSPISVTVGPGGAGGAAITGAGSGNSGIAGTSTLFGGYLWAKGGSASSGGSGATPIVAVTGGAGGVGTNVSGQGGSVLATAGIPTAATGQSTGGGGGGGCVAGTTVAAGSNGGTITGIASWGNPSAGVLDVTLITGFPTSGTVTVATSNTPALVSYTGTAAGQLTGCAYVSGGTGTVATGGAVTMAAPGAGCTATVMGTSSNSSAGGVVGGATPTNGSAPAAQGDTAPGGGGGAGSIGGSAQDGAAAQANSGGGGGGGGACQGGTTSGKGGAGGSGFALIIAYFQ